VTEVNNRGELLSKVPATTLGFWVVKILATTLGETGGDTVSMSWLGETTPETARSSHQRLSRRHRDVRAAADRARCAANPRQAIQSVAPLGATVGDFLDKPVASGGLDLGRPIAPLVLAVATAEPG
jgi:uncharacterized membrane-anchored protein